MTSDELRKAQLAAERDQRQSRVSDATRNDAVRRALSTGWTQAKIAEATGLTRGRIHQIVTPKPKP